MRNAWTDNTQYIVDLTNSLIGLKCVSLIIKENPECDPSRIRSYVMAAIMPKLEKMNPETLGPICAYASAIGNHAGKHFRGTPAPAFINRTGLNDVFPTDHRNYMFGHLGTGEFLVHIAMAVIVCVVADMIKQNEYQIQWLTWEMTREEQEVFVTQHT